MPLSGDQSEDVTVFGERFFSQISCFWPVLPPDSGYSWAQACDSGVVRSVALAIAEKSKQEQPHRVSLPGTKGCGLT